MDTKLTLKLNEDIIEKAKEYAKAKKTSLSDLIENYLQKLTSDNKSNNSITPLVKSLSGIINLPKDYNDKKDYTDYLTNKYK
ncbi:MAG: DUF6364 family protein [Bacteroidota bacterium]|nr:DUF6364 family protein [Bacteroidota bacterium]MDP3147085.1 DUF6364 family protein [Bacteroidota bacterium]